MTLARVPCDTLPLAMRKTRRWLLLLVLALIVLAPGWLYPWYYFDRVSPTIAPPAVADNELAALAHFFDGYLLERDGYLDRALVEYRQAVVTKDQALRPLAQSAVDRVSQQLVDPRNTWRITSSALELSRAIRLPGLAIIVLIAGVALVPRLIPRHGLGVAPFPVDAAVDAAAADMFRSVLLRNLETIRETLSSDSAKRIGIVLPDFAEASAWPGSDPLTTLDAFKGTSPTQVVQFSIGALWPFLAGLMDPKRYRLTGRVTLTRSAAAVVAEMREFDTGHVMGPWSVSSTDWPLVAGASTPLQAQTSGNRIPVLKPLVLLKTPASQQTLPTPTAVPAGPVGSAGWFHDSREDSERLTQAATVLAFQIWFDILHSDARYEYRPHSLFSLASTVRAVASLR